MGAWHKLVVSVLKKSRRIPRKTSLYSPFTIIPSRNTIRISPNFKTKFMKVIA